MIYEPKHDRIVVVPVYLIDEINARLDAAIKEHPEAEKDRQFLYESLLDFVDVHGYIPDFGLSKKPYDGKESA